MRGGYTHDSALIWIGSRALSKPQAGGRRINFVQEAIKTDDQGGHRSDEENRDGARNIQA